MTEEREHVLMGVASISSDLEVLVRGLPGEAYLHPPVLICLPAPVRAFAGLRVGGALPAPLVVAGQAAAAAPLGVVELG